MNRISLLLVLMAAALIGHAQGHGAPRKFRFQGSDGGSMVQLTHRPDVSGEIGLKEKQKGLLDDLETRMQDAVSKAMASGSDDPDEIRTSIAAVGDKFADELKLILTPPQYGRLRELLFQKTGYASILRKDVQAEIALDAGQRQAIQDSVNRMLERFDQLRSSGADAASMRAEIKVAIAERDAAVEKLLTPKQKALFHHMKGKPFLFEEREALAWDRAFERIV